MNIFQTQRCPIESAREHCNIHRNSQLKEGVQMLSTAHRVLDGDLADDRLYKICQPGNRFTKWARESDKNYLWLWSYCNELNNMFIEQNGRSHKSGELLDILKTLPHNISIGELSPVPIAESSDTVQYIYNIDPVLGHREYLCEKFSEWRERGKTFNFVNEPAWLV